MITDNPFTYMDEVGDPYVFNAMTQEDMANILALASNLLKECGIEFMLAFGTLLGAVRENSFIKGDDDVDIIVTDEKKLYESLPYLAERGLYINRIFETELYTFHSEGRKGHIDMYLRPIDRWLYKDWCVSIRGHYAPKRFFEDGIDKENYCIGDICYPNQNINIGDRYSNYLKFKINNDSPANKALRTNEYKFIKREMAKKLPIFNSNNFSLEETLKQSLMIKEEINSETLMKEYPTEFNLLFKYIYKDYTKKMDKNT